MTLFYETWISTIKTTHAEFSLCLIGVIFYSVIRLIVSIFAPIPILTQRKIDEKSHSEKEIKKELREYISYLVAFVNVSVSPFLTVHYLLTNPYTLDKQDDNISHELMITYFSFSYFVFDSLMMIIGKVDIDPLWVFHHLITIGFMLPTIMYHRYPVETIMLLCIGELSGPFNHMRVLFKYFEYHGIWDTIISGAFCIVFIFARVFLAEVSLSQVFYSTHSIYYKLFLIPVWWIGFIWVWQILNLAPKI